jgi:hypothetical protein
MKALVTLALLLSVTRPQVALPPRAPADHVPLRSRKGGRWYFAQNGHAVYCYGPVMLVPEAEGGLQRVATFCNGDRTMVPLKD